MTFLDNENSFVVRKNIQHVPDSRIKNVQIAVVVHSNRYKPRWNTTTLALTQNERWKAKSRLISSQ